jgi:MFS family permease
MPTSSQNKALNPTVVKLGLVSFFADISSEMLYPITPIFLTTVLGASMTSVGIVEGTAEAVASLLKTYSGFWSDRISRRKPFIALGYLLAAIAKPITGAAGNWQQVLLARALDRTGKGIRTAPRDALLAEAVSEKNRGAAFGWHRAMDTSGAILGPLLALLFLSRSPGNLRPIYYWAIIPGFLSVLLALSVAEKRGQKKRSVHKIGLFRAKDYSVGFKTFLVSWGIFSLTNSSDVFLLMKTRAAGLELKQTIILYCFYNFIYAFGSPYLGALSDRIGRKSLLAAGLVAFAAVYLGFAVASLQWQFWGLFGVYGLYMAATDGVGKAWAVDLIDPSQKASGLGVLGTVTGLATVVASTAAGALWQHAGPEWAFGYGAVGALVAAVLISRVDAPRPAQV